MTTAQQNFIKKIATAAQNNYATYKILPSLTIAQAILESNWGNSSLAKYYNFFGMKWSNGCGCNYVAKTTSEEYVVGQISNIVAKFRSYANINDGIVGYYKFLQYARYSNLKGVTNYKTACTLIKQDGWATDSSYTTKLINLIETYNLTQYDNTGHKVGYSAYVHGKGWTSEVFDEWTSGTTGKSLNCEAMSVKSYIDGVKVQGRAYFNGKWSKFSNDGCSIGNIGVPITAFEFRLTGANANKYNISYRGHFSNIGWTKFFSNEYTCGNAKQSNRLEAFEIKITAK